jgi:4-amino-4-deoxy-L-arabinose transferase-like glycosyltransferase
MSTAAMPPLPVLAPPSSVVFLYTAMSEAGANRVAGAERKWLVAGYLFIAAFFLSRLAYIAAGRIELSEDEAYQWLWSKHLDLSYYSKPPLIAYFQFLGTSLWGDTAFGIRFFSPLLAALLSLALLRFVSAEANARAGFWLVVALGASPIAAVGSTLFTIDAPSVFFWTLAMIAGWRAMQADSLKYWIATGIFVGLGFLSKYTAVVQVLSFPIYFALCPEARRHLRRPGPYVALALALLAALPVVWWNYRHAWVTLTHLSDRGGLNEPWHFRPGLEGEFMASEFGLLNPVFFVGAVWAAVGFWNSDKTRLPTRAAAGPSRRPLLLYLFTQGAPLFLFYFLYAVRSRVLPNWIAPSIVPLFTLMVLYWDLQWQAGYRAVKTWLVAGLAIGFFIVTLLHATELVQWVTGKPIPAKADPLHRVREWSRITQMIGAEREKLCANGKPVFIIAQHYGLASILSFYLPEAKSAVTGQPLVYCLRNDHPENQFYFWPGYEGRKGEDALYVEENDGPTPLPAVLRAAFTSVTDLGMRDARYHGQVFRRYQLYWCHDLK